MAQAERLSSAIAPLRLGGLQNDPQNLRGVLTPWFAGLPRHSSPPHERKLRGSNRPCCVGNAPSAYGPLQM